MSSSSSLDRQLFRWRVSQFPMQGRCFLVFSRLGGDTQSPHLSLHITEGKSLWSCEVVPILDLVPQSRPSHVAEWIKDVLRSMRQESNSAEGDGEPEFRYSFRKDRRCGGYLEVKVDKRLSQGSYWKLFSTGELLREAPHFGEGFVALMDILVEELQKLEGKRLLLEARKFQTEDLQQLIPELEQHQVQCQALFLEKACDTLNEKRSEIQMVHLKVQNLLRQVEDFEMGLRDMRADVPPRPADPLHGQEEESAEEGRRSLDAVIVPGRGGQQGEENSARKRCMEDEDHAQGMDAGSPEAPPTKRPTRGVGRRRGARGTSSK